LRFAEVAIFTAFGGLFGLETAGVVLLLAGEAASTCWLIGFPVGTLVVAILEALHAVTKKEGIIDTMLFAILAAILFGSVVGGLAIVSAEYCEVEEIRNDLHAENNVGVDIDADGGQAGLKLLKRRRRVGWRGLRTVALTQTRFQQIAKHGRYLFANG
jgi:hypothetical protein